MKRLIILFFTVAMVISCFTFTVEAKEKTTANTNWGITKQLCRRLGYKKIKLVDENKETEESFWAIVDSRKNKPYIVVTKTVSVSDGKGHGWYKTKDGNKYIIGYNKRVPRGKRVTSYCIWNPKTDYCDDVLYVVDNRTFR